MSFKNFLKKTIRILGYANGQWGKILILSLLTIVLSLIALINPYLVKILIDDVFLGKDFYLLTVLMIIFIGSYFFGSIIRIYHSYKSQELSENIVLNAKTLLFKHLEELDIGFFSKERVGDIMFRMDEDVYSIQSFISIIVDDILMNFLTALFILIVCLTLNWKVTLASLVFFPLYLIAQAYFGKKIKKQKEKLIEKDAGLLSFLQEALSSIQAIQTFVLETISLKKYRRKSKRLISLGLSMNLLENFANAIIGIITFTPLLIILWYGGHKVMTGALTVGSLIAIYTYITTLFDPISELGSVNIAIQSTFVSVKRVFEFLDTKPKITNKPDAKPIKNVKGEIEFKNVTFGYKPKEIVLDKISFKIKPKQIVGLVGESGSGKSTIANLICRFFDPNEGSVTLDGKDLKDLDFKSLRRNIGIVSQETILLNVSIKDNIKFGKVDASDKEVRRAAKLANIHESIIKLEKGYDTLVGERGVTLSGGEKQRISIARTILKNPKIVILDEGTSSLDAKTEKKVQEALKRVTKGKTTVIIAHRLSTINSTDKIFVLKDKKIVEEGEFADLIAKKGWFYQLYLVQMSGFIKKR